jgi:hypothetical protein
MARIGEVHGDPDAVQVSTAEGWPMVTVWLGIEHTDLTPDQADQLAAYLKVAAARARG